MNKKVLVISTICLISILSLLGGYLILANKSHSEETDVNEEILGIQDQYNKDNICELVNSQKNEDFDFNDMKDYPMPFKVTIKDIQIFMKMLSTMKTACEDNVISSEEEEALESMIENLSPEIQEQIETFREE